MKCQFIVEPWLTSKISYYILPYYMEKHKEEISMAKRTGISFLSIILLFFGIMGTIKPVPVSAGSHSQDASEWKQDCKITNLGKICGEKYKDYHITAKWSKSDVINVIENIDKYTSNEYGLITLVAGYVNQPLGLALTLNGMAWNNNNQFKTAKEKGTGLTWTYVYRLYKGGTTSTGGKIINSKWSY